MCFAGGEPGTYIYTHTPVMGDVTSPMRLLIALTPQIAAGVAGGVRRNPAGSVCAGPVQGGKMSQLLRTAAVGLRGSAGVRSRSSGGGNCGSTSARLPPSLGTLFLVALACQPAPSIAKSLGDSHVLQWPQQTACLCRRTSKPRSPKDASVPRLYPAHPFSTSHTPAQSQRDTLKKHAPKPTRPIPSGAYTNNAPHKKPLEHEPKMVWNPCC